MKIKRGSIIKSLVPITEYGTKIVPVGTIGTVYRVKRTGINPYSVVFENHHTQHSLNNTQIELAHMVVVKPTVGDLFYSSWGYGQTNIDFYQVVSVGVKSITVVRIADDRKYELGGMCGTTTPKTGQFRGPEETHQLRFDIKGRANFKLTSFSSAWPLDEPTKFFSEWN